MREEIDTLHTPFAQYLHGEKIPYVRARSDRESTIAEGHPDFTLLANGRQLMIEFKTKDGTTSKQQKARKAELEAAGNTVHIVRDLAVAIELTRAWKGSLGEVLLKTPASKPEDSLVRWGHGVFRKLANGRLEHVRRATPADEHIPAMAA